MEEFLKRNKFKFLTVLVVILFSAYIISGINEHTTIPDHIHSIDDKAENERTDEDNITILQRTLQKDPRNVEVLIQLTDLYIKTNNEKEAKKTLKEILDIDPYNKEANERLKKLDN